MYQDPHKFIDHRFCESGDFMLLICHMNSCEHMLKGLCAFYGWKPPRSKSLSFYVSQSLVQCKWRNTIFNLSYDLTRPRNYRTIYFYNWELLIVYRHPNKFGSPEHCGSGDILTLVCHVIPQDHVTDGQCDYTSGTFSR